VVTNGPKNTGLIPIAVDGSNDLLDIINALGGILAAIYNISSKKYVIAMELLGG
jgi:hypothetical protein